MTIIIQARMSSQRLPGKTMLPISGQPLLSWVVRRCLQTSYAVIVATPDTEDNQPIWDWCKQNNVFYFKGHPTDLTRRYADCAHHFYLQEGIVRITADCPFINTDIIKLCVAQWMKGDDYVGFHGLAGLNVEVFGVDRLYEAVTHGPDEHCTTWMRQQPWAKDLQPLEVNTKTDYERLKDL